MPKNIIVLMDGTWDKASNETNGIVTPSNVAKLSELLINDAYIMMMELELMPLE